MRKGTAMEGFIREDGTIRPIEHYDDTELRGKIQTNTDNISNLDSRVTELEEHGGVEDPTKADKVENATAGNLASLDEEGNLQDSGIDAGLVGKAKFLYKLEIAKSGGAYTWGTSTTQALLEEIYNSLENGPYDALPVRVQIPGFTYAGYAVKGQVTGVKEIDLYVGTIAFQAYYNTSTNLWNAPVIVKSAVVLDALKSTEQLSSGNDYRLITSGAVKAAIDEVNENIDNKHALEYEDETYLSRMGVGQLNRGDDELDGASVYGKDAIRLGVLGGSVYIEAENIANLQRALATPSSTPEDDDTKLITSKAVYDAIADRAYAETLNRRELQLGGIYLIKGTTLADYTIEDISTSAMQLYISAIAEIGVGRTDHLVIGLKDGATTYELLSTVLIESIYTINLYVGDIFVDIHRNSVQEAWALRSVTKISSIF